MNRSWNFRRGVLLALAGYTAFLVFAAPQRCADALQAGLRLCGGPLLVSLFPFLIVSALAAGCGAGQWLGFVFRPAARLMGIRAKGAGGVLLIGALGGFAPAAVAASEAVRSAQSTRTTCWAPALHVPASPRLWLISPSRKAQTPSATAAPARAMIRCVLS